MTKAEMTQYGKTEEGRQQAFNARQQAGTLWYHQSLFWKGSRLKSRPLRFLGGYNV
jgi:hypothetical protein